MVNYKFVHDKERCIRCGGCFAACKQQNGVPEDISRINIVTIDEGKSGERHITMTCMHCNDPPCVRACPVKGISKREDGIVINDKDKCIGCEYCSWACPFGAPKYPDTGPAELRGIMDKCTFCVIPYEQTDEYGTSILRAPNPKCAGFCATKARLGGDASEITATYNERVAGRLVERQIGV